jgi:hypothetical protein
MAFAYGALIWIAVSIAMHSFSEHKRRQQHLAGGLGEGSPDQCKTRWNAAGGPDFVGAIGSVFWLDLLYGIGVVFGIPKVLHIA